MKSKHIENWHNFSDDNDPNDLYELETLRLSFLDVGPTIQNLDFCEKVTEVFLNHNQISKIGNGFQNNKLIYYLDLQENLLQNIEINSLSHLTNLKVLNLKGNKLGEGLDAEQMKNFRETLA